MSVRNELQDQTLINLAQNDGVDVEARERLKRRMTQDRKPTSAGQSTWVRWGLEDGWLGQPFDTERIPLNKLAQMRRDPIIAFALMFIKVPLIRAPWYIKSADPRVASAVDASLRKIYGRFILAYCNAMDFGFSPMVKRFTYEEKPDWTYIPGDDPFAVEQPVWTSSVKPLVWKPFTALDPRKCSAHWNSKEEFNGIDFSRAGASPFFTSGWPWNGNGAPNAGSNRLADIPLEWALWATNDKDAEFGNLYGYPRIGPAYRFWWSYWYRFGLADRAVEKWGDPPWIAYHPDDPLRLDESGNAIDFQASALATLEQLRSGANAAVPGTIATTPLEDRATGMREWEFKQMESKIDFSSVSDMFRYLDIQKLRSVLVPEQALVEGEGGTSSRNVASVFGDLFQEAQIVVKEEIDDHLNRWVIPQFVELNFGQDAAKAEIVTTGFRSMDMDTMRSVLQLVGQRKLLSVVDERELAERMNIPTVSRVEALRRLNEETEDSTTDQPPTIDSIADEAAGVSPRGLYYSPRERIVLGEQSTLPYLIERVDDLPEQEEPAAYFDAGSRILYIKKDADPEKVTGYLLGLTEKMTSDGVSIPDGIVEALSAFRRELTDRIDDVSRDRKVQLELERYDEDESDFDVEREIERDSETGLIKKVIERKVPREQSD